MRSDQPKALLLSDLWGFRKDNWQSYYKTLLLPHYNTTMLDSTILAGIPQTIHQQDNLHAQFIDGGIDLAVNYLCSQAEGYDLIIGVSIGGTIAWKAMLKGLQTKKLIGLSATRLRYETQKPKSNIRLIYGTEDPYAPNTSWFQQMNIEPIMLVGQGHDLYKDQSILDEIIKAI